MRRPGWLALGTIAIACATAASGAEGARKAAKAEARPASSCAAAIRPARGSPSVTVRLLVRADGQPERFEVLTPGVGATVAAALWDGLRACRWEPALGSAGKPIPSWVALAVAPPR